MKKSKNFFQIPKKSVHEMLEDTLKQFLTAFVKPETIKNLNGDLSSQGHPLPPRHIFVGATAEKIHPSLGSEARENFRTTLLKAYVAAGQYMQRKFPLHNDILKSLSSLDPAIRGHTAVI